jgi:hypothetical protein
MYSLRLLEHNEVRRGGADIADATSNLPTSRKTPVAAKLLGLTGSALRVRYACSAMKMKNTKHQGAHNAYCKTTVVLASTLLLLEMRYLNCVVVAWRIDGQSALVQSRKKKDEVWCSREVLIVFGIRA